MNTTPKRNKQMGGVNPIEPERSSSFMTIGQLAKAFGLARSTLLIKFKSIDHGGDTHEK